MRRKLLLAAGVAIVAGTGMSGADPRPSQTPPERSGAPAGLEAVLAAPVHTDTGLPTFALLDAVEAWLVAGFDLPRAGERPRVAFLPPPTMSAMRLTEAPANRLRQYAEPEDEDEASTVAIYNSMTRTIYLPEGWTGDTPAELSILVHEMVHHLQNIAGLRYPCAEAQEAPAYDAQAAWLALFGTDLEAEFEVDAFARFVRTRCFL